MRLKIESTRLRAGLLAACVAALAACTIAKPRTDDPWDCFTRKMYAFNDAADKTVIRPAAVGYRKITTPNMRRVVANFFANIKMPITIVNDVLQAEPKAAIHNTGRFAVNTTLGFLGLFDPASEMSLPPRETDFGVTLAKWGLPEGPYLVLPLIGPTTTRDVWRMPVDNWFDPLGWYAREHEQLNLFQRHLPNIAYLVTLRSRGIDAEGLLEGVYDPYVFYRDAYRQRRLYDIYDREPPVELIEQMQGTQDDADIEELLKEQQDFENKRNNSDGGDPPPA